MAYAITQTCCTDASCIAVCPVNCIHPAPGEPDFGTTEVLYIDPRTCIDCGACADACPVDAVSPVDVLSGADAVYAERGARYYAGRTADPVWSAPLIPRSLPAGTPAPRVAVVGTGPAACYAVQALLHATDAEVTMIDRLPVPGGLVRFGVAPDHISTKRIGESFAALLRHPRVRVHLGVEVGVDLGHADLARHHHAVVYAVGAAAARPLGIPGEDLPGSLSATRFVAWYNDHPEVPGGLVDLSDVRRAVVVGNGNVALDTVRVLAGGPDRLAGTGIAGHALAALRSGAVREVVVLGRRGPQDAAYTWPELHALKHLPGVRLVVADTPGTRAAISSAAPDDHAALLSDVPIEAVDLAAPPPPGRRIVLNFFSSPVEVLGNGRMSALRTTTGPVDAQLLIGAIGYRGTPLPDLPFDSATATVPHERGRVAQLPGTYVVGWIKRGPSGGIGANRLCAQETVDTLLDDAAAGRLPTPPATARDFARLIRNVGRDAPAGPAIR
ncbi:FAD-dependent oxidoreductase [Streptomyces sp. SL13]|uniref:ferredoxin--NADP(+) reductase n=1 Tax=Streptantibioticus silvisoli TaxID=2705255 RepID=A0AA90K1C8_9ACTN|nr:FAD-dependent oxidoreductase [Streptantibioticus silvisoli]MDI5973751.1 FAD-dependent oxidoreductase [Streptantibioticus silvisoli]